MKSSITDTVSNTLQPDARFRLKQMNRRQQWRAFIAVLIASDIVMVAVAFGVAFIIRFQSGWPVFRTEVQASLSYYRPLTVAMVGVWLLAYIASDLYRRSNLLGGLREYERLARASLLGFLVVISLTFLDAESIRIARGWLLLGSALAFLFSAVGRFTARRCVYALRTLGYFMTPAVIVGTNEEAKTLAQALIRWRKSGLQILGFIDETLPAGTQIEDNLTVLGNQDTLPALIEDNQIGELIIATSALSREEMLAYFQRYGIDPMIDVRLSSGLFELIATGLSINEIAQTPLITVNRTRLTGFDSFLKHVIDYALTIPGLLLISPVLLFIAIAIRLDSPGPVIYRRRVMGLNGRQFDAFKFRTMVINGEEVLNQHPELKAQLAREHKLRHDPRITRVGHILRKYSLDEFPQLINVLRRDMSLVGPRMISPPEMERYGRWGLNLLTVRPGITGLWQVSGRSDIDYEQRIQLDMQYIRRWTVWLDFYILLRTIPAVLQSRGAY